MKPYHFILILFFTLFAGITSTSAQTVNVKGKIIYANGRPAAGARITLQNSTIGTVADSLGNYTLSLNKGTHFITAHLLGQQAEPQKITLSGEKTIFHVPIIILPNKGQTLATVTVHAKAKMHLSRKHGKLTVAVANTRFEDTRNVWEGLKRVPMLSLQEGKNPQILGKNALVEINGVRTHMSGADLQAYLKSLDPKNVEKIEIEPNPGAAYGAEVEAYINIVLKQRSNNYSLGVRTTNAMHTNYTNSTGIYYALNLKKVSLYTNYNFDYDPEETNHNLARRIGVNPLVQYTSHNLETPREHQATANLSINMSKKDLLVLNNYVSFSNTDMQSLAKNADFTRSVHTKNKSHQLQFSQVWKHNFNDSVSLKISAYEVFQKAKAHNYALDNNQDLQTQNINTSIPLYIGRIDYKNTNTWGITSIGAKFSDISVQNDNHNFGKQEYTAPYHYDEKVLAAYLNHQFSFANGSNLSLGIRSETSIIDYTFNAPTGSESYSNHPRYTNLFYSAQYNWMTPKKRLYNIAFKKTIKRPDYSSLNPFRSISSDGIYASGDTELDPQQTYELSFYTHKDSFTFYGFAVYVNKLITEMYDVKDNHINTTYQNLKDVYATGIGVKYNHSFFNDFWNTKTSLEVRYIDLYDPSYNGQKEKKPFFWIKSNNTFKISNGFYATLDYWFRSNKAPAGIIKMLHRSSLDISLTKKLGRNFTAILFVNDIFRTHTADFKTTLTGYYYQDYSYNDHQAIGLTLKYNIAGKAYKKHHLQNAQDDAINRLN